MPDEIPEFKPAERFEKVGSGLKPISDDEWPLYEWFPVTTYGDPAQDIYRRGNKLVTN
jgi:hypothetical protein